jgi:predicted amino acid-binding ACT domain protein
MNFIDKKTSVKQAMSILAKNGIQVNDTEASVILEFLYIIAKNYNKHKANQNAPNLKENSNLEKTA